MAASEDLDYVKCVLIRRYPDPPFPAFGRNTVISPQVGKCGPE